VLNKLKPRCLPLPVNICLFITLFAFTLLYSLFVDSITGRVFHVLSWITAVSAIVPIIPLLAEFKESTPRAKEKYVSSDVQQKVDKLCQKMDVKKKVTVKLVNGWWGAKAQDAGILLGKPLLDNFDDASIDAVLAHELAHIKKDHRRRAALEITVPFLLLIAYSWYFFHVRSIPIWPNLLIFCALFLLLFIILLRAISWPQEYEADAVGAKYTDNNTMVATLRTLAKLKGTDIEQDTYSHPSISRRIANLTRK